MEKESQDTTVAINARIPSSLYNKLIYEMQFKGYSSKTEALINILIDYFDGNKSSEKELARLIDKVFSVSDKALIPISLYQKLTKKTDEEIMVENQDKKLEIKKIDSFTYVVLGDEKINELTVIEQLLQKKQISQLQNAVLDMKKTIAELQNTVNLKE